MRAMFTMLISVATCAFVAACAFMPDSLIVTPRIDKRGNYDSTSIGLVFRNPWKPRIVREEYISADGGSSMGDMP